LTFYAIVKDKTAKTYVKVKLLTHIYTIPLASHDDR